MTPSRHGLLGEQELRHHLGQRPAAGDQPQHAVLVEALDRREIERERLMQLVDDQLRHLLDVALAGQPRGQPRRQPQLLAQVGELAGRRQALHARVGAVAAQRLGAAPALLGPARADGLRALCRQLGHGGDAFGRFG